MTHEHKTVFISYRRNVASFIARAIFQDLRANGYDVFMDVESIDSGQFDTIILRQIEARAHFLVILTPGTVERCAEPGDWLRREIEHAMDKQRNIVPLLVSDFKFQGTEPYLTDKLADLARFNAVNVPHDYFEAAMDRLRSRFLKQPLYGVVKPTPASDQPEVQRKIAEVAAQPTPTDKELSAEDYAARAFTRDEKDFEGKIADYSEAIRQNPKYTAAYNNRGTAHHDKGEYDEAIADYDEAIRLSPSYALAYNNRGVTRKAKGDLDGAIADYDEAIRLNLRYADAYSNRGNARQAKGDLDGAISDYSEALLLNPQYANGYYNRGVLRQAKGDLDGAISDYGEALLLDPQRADAYNNLGNARKAKGDLDGAISDYSEALLLNPRYANAYKNRGIARRVTGDLKGTIGDYQRYLDLGGGKQNGDQTVIEEVIRDLQRRLKS